ncbi:MAG: PEPxxWA-CTERM sorting domain-containing protein [Pseudomonadota bacterium]|uniref:PEPxxWA-CTERM sorting domain-containing protein n=1 Tax=Phenylobacterium sp. TaxID=1871053 RepID=UPI0025E2F827|nr:PEPxxWA-CTERM sorting domain-containing protein [Phenylobacterium sp.]
MKKFLVSLAASALFALPAHAGTVFSDNFDTDNGGNSGLNYTGFANWDVVGGTVDVVKSGDYGITCAGSCVDLDGSTGQNGKIQTKQSFNFTSNNLIEVNYDVTGNQRGGGLDSLFGVLVFDAPTTLHNVTFFGVSFGDFTTPSLTFQLSGIPSNYPLTNVAFSATTGNAGSFRLQFGTNSGGDNMGPLLDNVSIGVSSAVPEPATWAMMIMGFGLVGSAMRRRQALHFA